MSLTFLVNAPEAIESKQTTATLVERASQLGMEPRVMGVDDLSVGSLGEGRGRVRTVLGVEPLVFSEPREVSFGPGDRVLVRTNPGRATHRAGQPFALQVLELMEQQGVALVNPTAVLRRFGTKLGCMYLPEEIRPVTRILTDPSAVRDFVKDFERCVVKPLSGTHGDGVFILDREDRNLVTATSVLRSMGPVVVQEWLPQAVEGDVRMFMVDGEVLCVDGSPALVRRRPDAGELRSNVHLGATPQRQDLTAELSRVAERASPVLRAHGVRVVGLDCIGDRVVETNVYSPGGLADAGRFHGVDFHGPFLSALT